MPREAEAFQKQTDSTKHKLSRVKSGRFFCFSTEQKKTIFAEIKM